jgi:hypothetical protein
VVLLLLQKKKKMERNKLVGVVAAARLDVQEEACN